LRLSGGPPIACLPYPPAPPVTPCPPRRNRRAWPAWRARDVLPLGRPAGRLSPDRSKGL